MAGPKRSRPTGSGGDRLLARIVGRPVARFLQVEAAGSIVLLAATVVALIWANLSASAHLPGPVDHGAVDRRRRPGAHRGPPTPGERRPHGPVLLRQRPRDQAGGGLGPAMSARGGATGGGGGRDGGPRAFLVYLALN